MIKDKDYSDIVNNNLKNNNNENENDNNSNIEKNILSEVNRNQIILEDPEKKQKNFNLNNLPDLLYNLDYSKKIGNIIDVINNLLMEKGKSNLFKKDDFNIHFNKMELDKFFKVKKVHKEFSLKLKYSLSNDKNN